MNAVIFITVDELNVSYNYIFSLGINFNDFHPWEPSFSTLYTYTDVRVSAIKFIQEIDTYTLYSRRKYYCYYQNEK